MKKKINEITPGGFIEEEYFYIEHNRKLYSEAKKIIDGKEK